MSTDPCPPGRTPPGTGDRLRFYLVLFAVLALGVALLAYRIDLAFRVGWILAPLPYHPFPSQVLLPSVLILGAAGLLLWRVCATPQPSRRASLITVCLLWLTTCGLQVTSDLGLGRRAWAVNVVASTWSELSNGYFAAATRIEQVGQFLTDYHAIQLADSKKLSTHPPGAVLVYCVPIWLYRHLPGVSQLSEWLLRQASGDDLIGLYLSVRSYPNVPELPFEALGAAFFAALFIAGCGATATVACYRLGTAAAGRRTGLLAAALFACMPSTLFYYLSLDVIMMALTAWALVAVVESERQGQFRWWPLPVAGALLGVGLLISLGGLAPAALIATVTGLIGRRRRWPVRRLGLALALLAGGLLAVLLAVSLAGMPTGAVLWQCLVGHQHGEGGIRHRPYLPWLFLNLFDYAMLAGIPVIWAWLEGLWRRDFPSDLPWAMAVAALLVMLLLNLSGVVRGETERIWIFFNPIVAASAAAAVAGQSGRVWPLAVLPLQLLLLSLALPPLVRPY